VRQNRSRPPPRTRPRSWRVCEVGEVREGRSDVEESRTILLVHRPLARHRVAKLENRRGRVPRTLRSHLRPARTRKRHREPAGSSRAGGGAKTPPSAVPAREGGSLITPPESWPPKAWSHRPPARWQRAVSALRWGRRGTVGLGVEEWSSLVVPPVGSSGWKQEHETGR